MLLMHKEVRSDFDNNFPCSQTMDPLFRITKNLYICKYLPRYMQTHNSVMLLLQIFTPDLQ